MYFRGIVDTLPRRTRRRATVGTGLTVGKENKH